MFGMFCKTDEYGGGDHVFQRVNDVFGERIGATERKGIVQHDRYTRKRKWCLYHRRRKKMINLASNNYLGFANHKELKKACIEATETYGVGAGAVRTINGSLKIHQQLEEKSQNSKGQKLQSPFNLDSTVIWALSLQ